MPTLQPVCLAPPGVKVFFTALRQPHYSGRADL